MSCEALAVSRGRRCQRAASYEWEDPETARPVRLCRVHYITRSGTREHEKTNNSRRPAYLALGLGAAAAAGVAAATYYASQKRKADEELEETKQELEASLRSQERAHRQLQEAWRQTAEAEGRLRTQAEEFRRYQEEESKRRASEESKEKKTAPPPGEAKYEVAEKTESLERESEKDQRQEEITHLLRMPWELNPEMKHHANVKIIQGRRVYVSTFDRERIPLPFTSAEEARIAKHYAEHPKLDRAAYRETGIRERWKKVKKEGWTIGTDPCHPWIYTLHPPPGCRFPFHPYHRGYRWAELDGKIVDISDFAHSKPIREAWQDAKASGAILCSNPCDPATYVIRTTAPCYSPDDLLRQTEQIMELDGKLHQEMAARVKRQRVAKTQPEQKYKTNTRLFHATKDKEIEAATKFLQEQGYVVFSNVLEEKECVELKDKFLDWMEAVSSEFKRDDPQTWTHDRTPNDLGLGLLKGLGIGQSSFLWGARRAPGCRRLFERLLPEAKGDFVTSYDGAAFLRGNPGSHGRPRRRQLWPHVDYNYHHPTPGGPEIQAGLNIVSGEHIGRSGAFVCVPGSHLIYKKLWEEKHLDVVTMCSLTTGHYVPLSMDNELVSSATFTVVPVPMGGAVFWYSSTVHCNLPPARTEKTVDDMVRLVAFVSFTPRAQLLQTRTEEEKKQFAKDRRTAAALGYTGSHTPMDPKENNTIMIPKLDHSNSRFATRPSFIVPAMCLKTEFTPEEAALL